MQAYKQQVDADIAGSDREEHHHERVAAVQPGRSAVRTSVVNFLFLTYTLLH